MSVFTNAKASWVWPSALPAEPNQYVEFRHEFDLEKAPSHGALHISVDSDYAVWLNGRFVDCGQFHDFPDHKTYDSLRVEELLRPGRNVLCVLVYYQGEGFFQYIKGDPGLIYVLEMTSGAVTCSSGTHWRVSPCYRRGPVDKITFQLGFTFEYDAGHGDSWTSPDYQPGSDWRPIADADITGIDTRPAPSPRPIDKLFVGDRIPAAIVTQGLFRREASEGKTVAACMQTDYLSTRHLRDLSGIDVPPPLPVEGGLQLKSNPNTSDGFYVIIDLGREEVGLFDIELDAHEGQTIDLAWGEHLDDGRVRAGIWGRNFACRYQCGSGRQTFTHYFRRFGCRYIQLHVFDAGKGITLYYAGMRSVEYPVEVRGSFSSNDRLLAQICDTSVRTLHLCMEEHYVDCPWREQALYTNDSRNQALCGYYCFGEYDFPAVSFDLLGRSLKPDGYLELCAPAEIAITIPSFSMQWILELADYLLYTGNVDFIRRQYPVVKRMIESYAGVLKNGLMPCPQGDRYWHFYDWAPGLDGTDLNDAGRFVSLGSPRYDAPLNMLLVLALEAAAKLAIAYGAGSEAVEANSYLSLAGELKQATHEAFWDREKQLYLTYKESGAPAHYAELTQALALLSGCCPEPAAPDLRRRIREASGELVPTTLSQSLIKYEAMLVDASTYGTWVFEQIITGWSAMLFRGATSFWETIKGSSDFGGAGSLCHGWSAIPLYFAYAYLLGVKPVEPGFRKFEFSPVTGVVDRASGVIPTPHGPITVKWSDTPRGMDKHIDYPPEITLIKAPKEATR